jgi:hypothetical protein
MECAPLCFVTIGFWCVSMQHGPQGHNMARSTDVHHVMASQQEGSRAFERWPTIRIGWMRCRLHRGSETEGLEGSNKGCVRGVGGGGARTLCIIIINLHCNMASCTVWPTDSQMRGGNTAGWNEMKGGGGKGGAPATSSWVCVRSLSAKPSTVTVERHRARKGPLSTRPDPQVQFWRRKLESDTIHFSAPTR